MKRLKTTIDFETRSILSVRDVGAFIYAHHPSTQVLCLAYKIGEAEAKLWHRGHPSLGIEESPFPEDLAQAIADGCLVEAHNNTFERWVWEVSLLREFPNFPKIPLKNMRCSAAKAAAFALPRALKDLAKALRLSTEKDMEGYKAMMKCCKPRKLTAEEKKEYKAQGIDPNTVVLWHNVKEDYLRTNTYCVQDVVVEHACSESLPELNPIELEYWQMDQRMNARGFYCDMALCHSALKMSEKAATSLNAELNAMTSGAVPRGSCRGKFKKWIHTRGIDLPNTQAKTLEKFLKTDLEPDIQRALEISIQVNKTSASKFKSMLKSVHTDSRIRDTMVFNGARTGRWAGARVQPHNFLRGFNEWMEQVCEDILLNDPEIMEILYGEVLPTLAKATRGAISAPPGRDLIVVDFAAIEARVLLWLIDDEENLDRLFRSGLDPYKIMASSIYNVVYDQVIKDQRFIGKQTILGLGYGMGPEKFDDTCTGYGVENPRDFYKEIVELYRKETFPLIPAFWKAIEKAAIEAVKNPGKTIPCGKVKWAMKGRFLYCQLPSGRLLAYAEPLIRSRVSYAWEAVNIETGKPSTIRVTQNPKYSENVAWQKAFKIAKEAGKRIVARQPYSQTKDQLTYMHVNSSKEGKWERTETYGGKLTENVTQAVARDLMANGMLNADNNQDYDILLSVHDELISEVDEDKGSMDEYAELLTTIPVWAQGCPIAAEGWRGKRYKKA